MTSLVLISMTTLHGEPWCEEGHLPHATSTAKARFIFLRALREETKPFPCSINHFPLYFPLTRGRDAPTSGDERVRLCWGWETMGIGWWRSGKSEMKG